MLVINVRGFLWFDVYRGWMSAERGLQCHYY